MNGIPTRIVIYAKDIMLITGKCERTARRMIAAIKKKFDKPATACITIDDFCLFTGLKQMEVSAYLK